jgi:predicted Zn-ribbon and HTH transcriptional regulator
MTDPYCLRCKHAIPGAALLPIEKAAVAALYRQQGPMAAVQHLYGRLDFSLAHAKAMVLHLTPTPNVCHRCSNQHLSQGEAICPKCKSVNLNW